MSSKSSDANAKMAKLGKRIKKKQAALKSEHSLLQLTFQERMMKKVTKNLQKKQVYMYLQPIDTQTYVDILLEKQRQDVRKNEAVESTFFKNKIYPTWRV